MNRLGAGIAGCVLLLGFFGLSQVVEGYAIDFWGPWSRSTPGELRLWLATTLILFPACCLLGWSLRDAVFVAGRNVNSLLRKLTTRHKCWALFVLFGLSFSAARLGNTYILGGFPIADDEWGTKFGGDVLAAGSVLTPAVQPEAAFDHRFLYKRDGLVTSFDWPGVLATWAFAKITGTDSLSWAIAGSCTAVVLVLLIYFQYSISWAVVAAFILLFSPMIATLNMTTHAHVLSKLPLALAIFFYFLGSQRGKFLYWSIAGFAGATACAFRLFECFAILLPFLIYSGLNSWKTNSKFHRSFLFILLGAALPVLAQAWYYQALTGHFWLPPRMAIPGVSSAVATIRDVSNFWGRFGANFTQNTLLLGIWFMGILGIIAFAAGVGVNWFSKLCSWSILSALCVALLHDDHGLHLTGPIHYSECVIPLLIVCIGGLRRIWLHIATFIELKKAFFTSAVLFMTLGLGCFTFFHWTALRSQAKIHETIFGFVTDETRRLVRERNLDFAAPVIVVTPRYADVWMAVPNFRANGTFVYDWPIATPGLKEPISFALSYDGVESELTRLYPDHLLLELTTKASPPYLEMKAYVDTFNQ